MNDVEGDAAVMGLVRNIADAVGAQVGRLLDRLEDPSETLALARSRQQELLEEVRGRLDEVAVSRAVLEAEAARGQALAEELAEEAGQAQGSGSDDTAREKLDRRGWVLVRLAEIGEEHRALADQEVRLVETERRLKERIAEFTRLAETVEATQTTDEVRSMVDRAVAEAARMEKEESRFEAGL